MHRNTVLHLKGCRGKGEAHLDLTSSQNMPSILTEQGHSDGIGMADKLGMVGVML